MMAAALHKSLFCKGIVSRSNFILTPKYTFSTTSCLEKKTRAEWRKWRRPADTRFRPHREDNYVKERKAFGGRKKLKALQVVKGNYTLQSQGIGEELRILDVVHDNAGPKYREKNIIAKGTYLLVDALPLKDRIDIDKLGSPVPMNGEQVDTEKSASETDKGDSGKAIPSEKVDMSQSIINLLEEGKLYAKVTVRPGQEGSVDGEIVEGVELASLLEILENYEKSV